jgi:hypothetical protein
MGSKMKTLSIAVIIAILLISIIAILPSNLAGGNLECSDFTKCKGLASCGGPGEESQCVLTCSGGGTIYCNDPVPNQ